MPQPSKPEPEPKQVPRVAAPAAQRAGPRSVTPQYGHGATGHPYDLGTTMLHPLFRPAQQTTSYGPGGMLHATAEIGPQPMAAGVAPRGRPARNPGHDF